MPVAGRSVPYRYGPPSDRPEFRGLGMLFSPVGCVRAGCPAAWGYRPPRFLAAVLWEALQMITPVHPPGPGSPSAARSAARPAVGPSPAPGRPAQSCGPVARAAASQGKATPAAAAVRCDATRLPPRAVQPPPRLAATPQQERLAAALTPAARARGVKTAAELVAADDAPGRVPVPSPSAASQDPATVDDTPAAPAALAGDRGPVTRQEVERAARAGRWVGLATPAAWEAALDRDEERHYTALSLLRRENWGLYERQRLLDREVSELWRAVQRLGEALRRAVRGDTRQEALFGLLVDREGMPHEA